MNQTMRVLIRALVVAGVVAACGKAATAAPGDKYCPPLCTLPPDPAPPMPPISYPDPPFNPTVASNPNRGHNGQATTTAVMQPGGVTVPGKVQEGAECRSRNNVEGTLVADGAKFKCNFMPSTLKVGGACHANNTIGKVVVVDGTRYCNIGPPGAASGGIAVSDQAKPSDKKKTK